MDIVQSTFLLLATFDDFFKRSTRSLTSFCGFDVNNYFMNITFAISVKNLTHL